MVVGGSEEDMAGYGRLKQCEHSLPSSACIPQLQCWFTQGSNIRLHSAMQSRVVDCAEDIS